MGLNSSLSCNFSGSVCSWERMHCDAKGNVLKASIFGLSGLIPAITIGKLTKLQSLDLSNNKITALPSDIWSLGMLKSLNLSSNQISGSLPNNIGNFGLLEVIDLSGNNFSGEIPAALDLSSNRSLIFALPKLKALNLAGNEIHGRDTGFAAMMSLTSLNISRNLFNGSIMSVSQATSVPVVIFEKPLLTITFADLLSATLNFDRGTLLAEGKFGPVYGGFLPGGIHVAVKVLAHGSTLTDQEAARELEYLGRIKHTNLVPLTGYCLAGDQRIDMENGNLQNLLHDLPLGVHATEDWSNDSWEEDNNGLFRHKIALGTGPRLSDFGLAKIFGTELGDEIAGESPGYVPPEFSQPECHASTPKSDVYCFDVVLFELITGKKPTGDNYPEEQETNLVSWVRGLVRKNQGSKAIDPKIRDTDTGPDYQMKEALKIGYLCTADVPTKRPSMQQIVGLLKAVL
ncbi:hypothetical protein GQ457_16G000900 [Hibiscus cannabinus]